MECVTQLFKVPKQLNHSKNLVANKTIRASFHVPNFQRYKHVKTKITTVSERQVKKLNNHNKEKHFSHPASI